MLSRHGAVLALNFLYLMRSPNCFAKPYVNSNLVCMKKTQSLSQLIQMYMGRKCLLLARAIMNLITKTISGTKPVICKLPSPNATISIFFLTKAGPQITKTHTINRVVKQLTTLLMVSLLMTACGGSVAPNQSQEPDPVVVDVPIAYIKRDLSVAESSGIRPLEDPSMFLPGASLIIKARANASAQEVDITSSLFAEMVDENGNPLPYDIKDLDSDYTGTRLVFAMRAPELPDMDVAPTWNIWEFDVTTQDLRRIISSDLVAEAGQDTGPTYLADGRIVFSSTRQRGNQARLLDEGKPQYSGLEESREFPASVLHVMNTDGAEIRQISFNQSHDFDPVVLPNGKILFSRWDQAGGNKGIHLYQINADGSELEILYGRHSHNSIEGLANIQFAATSITPDSRVLAAVNSFDQTRLGTDFFAIDTTNFIDNQTPIDSMQGLSGPAQESALFDNIDIINAVSPGGYIVALYPLWDGSGRILFSWNQCRLLAPLALDALPGTTRTIAPCNAENIGNVNYTPAPDLFGLWMFRPATNTAQATQLPLNLADEAFVVTEIVALESRPFPSNPNTTVDASATELMDDKYGVLHIRSVYDVDGTDTTPNGIVNMANPLAVEVNERPARFLRVVKSVSIPDEDTLEITNQMFGRSRNQLFREILGYTPIQPDGSVQVTVPAGVPFAVSIVNAQGKRISARHNNWLQVVPGEQKTCIGCHANNSTAPHGRIDAQPTSVNAGALNTGVAFPNTNPALFADSGETMAQTYSRLRGLPKLTANIQFEDVWNDDALSVPAPAFSYRYEDLDTALPISQSCAQNWTALCRAVINFPDHIEPILTLTRQTFDDDMVLLADNTCTSCHSPTDETGELRVPLGQLDLRGEPSAAEASFTISYRELLFNDNEQEIVEGVLLDKIVAVLDGDGNPTFLLDEDGELVLDAQNNPIPITTTVGIGSSMQVNGAINSNRFFRLFEANNSHAGMLSEAELRLIAEWLDIGGQYYNNPFEAPQD
jgi:hypothetical protein